MSQGHALLRAQWISVHANGYPVIVALVELAVGRRLETALLLLNLVFSTAIVELAARLARRLGSQRASVTAAAWVAALWPNQLV